jgi:hypothetical protein
MVSRPVRIRKPLVAHERSSNQRFRHFAQRLTRIAILGQLQEQGFAEAFFGVAAAGIWLEATACLTIQIRDSEIGPTRHENIEAKTAGS